MAKKLPNTPPIPHREAMLQDLCGVLFNTMAMMREMLDAD